MSHRTLPFRPLIAALLVCAVLAGCASGQGNREERWQVYDDEEAAHAQASSQPQSGAVRTVFFRVADVGRTDPKVPVNLYINGHYQASLIDASYTQVYLCPGPVGLSLHPDDVTERYVTKEQGRAFSVQPGQVQYFEVYDSAPGTSAVRAVSAEAVSRKPGGLGKLQSHTISRVVVPACPAG